jgi:hypothetical protein
MKRPGKGNKGWENYLRGINRLLGNRLEYQL